MPSFQKIIDIIADAFSILDFSHIISGTATFLIVILGLYLHDIYLELMSKTLTIVCGLFLAYISGILSWIIGRTIRKKLQNIGEDFRVMFNDTMKAVYSKTAIDIFPIRNENDAYAYMWIELTKMEEAKKRVDFINRFWIMQAMFEGLMTSCLTAFILVVELKISFGDDFSCGYCIALLLLLFILFILCMNAAQNNARTQIKEVIISYYSYTEK